MMEKKLLQQYVEGNVTAEEIEQVVDWLDASEEHVREFMAVHKLYDISLMNKPAFGTPAILPKRHVHLRKAAYELLKIAAVFLVIGGGMHLLNRQAPPETPMAYQTLFVPAGQRAELILPDSTKVWLNAKSQLVYPAHFEKGNREVTLNGEAYFQVTHREKQPFVVKTGQMDIHVLGTEFNVIAYAGQSVSEVALLKGSVHVKAPGIAQGYTLKADENIKFRDGKLHTSPISDYDHFKWREGLICFHNETVGDMIEKLQVYYDIRIEADKASLLKLRYTGKFRTKDGVEQVLKVLQLEHKFTYARDNELNVITIK
ncbi:MAG: FecR domain-containing protein [Tannerella sp.]|jgi:ferric-dicitrate binding protein FerR (iron transport regulator)|nr:FecR domain-containing protein [Tannerella sp.]